MEKKILITILVVLSLTFISTCTTCNKIKNQTKLTQQHFDSIQAKQIKIDEKLNQIQTKYFDLERAVLTGEYEKLFLQQSNAALEDLNQKEREIAKLKYENLKQTLKK